MLKILPQFLLPLAVGEVSFLTEVQTQASRNISTTLRAPSKYLLRLTVNNLSQQKKISSESLR